jgi:hypothetical protein
LSPRPPTSLPGWTRRPWHEKKKLFVILTGPLLQSWICPRSWKFDPTRIRIHKLRDPILTKRNTVNLSGYIKLQN